MTDDQSANTGNGVDPEEVESGDFSGVADSASREELELLITELETRLESRENRIGLLEDEVAKARKQAKRERMKQEKLQEKSEEKIQEKVDETQRETAKDVIQMFFQVRDNLFRAISQEENTDIRQGVEATLNKFDEILASEGIEVINPESGSEVDPNRHKVVARVEADQPEGKIAQLYQPGYESDRGVIIREAQVAVSDN